MAVLDPIVDRNRLSDPTSAHGLRRPFWLSGKSGTGVLVVHGFTGTPFEMRFLGEALHRAGHTVHGPRLTGHADNLPALGGSTWREWVESVDAAYTLLSAEVDRVFVCGLSLGGLLTLDLAARRGAEPTSKLAGIEVLSAPLWLSRVNEAAIAITRRLRRTPNIVLPAWGGSDLADPEMRRRNHLAQGRGGLPIPAVMSLRDFMDHVRAELDQVNVPTLLVHSRSDHTAPFACMKVIADGVATRDLEQLELTRSFHVVTLDYDRVLVAERVRAHIERLS